MSVNLNSLLPTLISVVLFTSGCTTTETELIGNQTCPKVKNFVSAFIYPDGITNIPDSPQDERFIFRFLQNKNKTIQRPNKETPVVLQQQYKSLSREYLNPVTWTENKTESCAPHIMPYARKIRVIRTKVNGTEEDISKQATLQFYTYKEAFLSGLQRRGGFVKKLLTEIEDNDLKWLTDEPEKAPILKVSPIHDGSKLTLVITLADGTELRAKLNVEENGTPAQ